MVIMIEKIVSLMILLLGVSFLFQPRMWVAFARDIMDHPHKSVYFTIPLLPMGLIIVLGHPIWKGFVTTIITLIGWGMVVKSVTYMCCPGFVNKFAGWSDAFMTKGLRFAGAAYVLFGVFLVMNVFTR